MLQTFQEYSGGAATVRIPVVEQVVEPTNTADVTNKKPSKEALMMKLLAISE